MMDGHSELRAEVLHFIERGVMAPPDEGTFERLALAAFEYQFAENEPYRQFCERRNLTPGSVSRWTDIPAVPTAAFKEAALICGDPVEAEIVFLTSGTSQGPERRGAHYVRDLALYRAAALPNFQAHLLPDAARMKTLVLGPPAALSPGCSNKSVWSSAPRTALTSWTGVDSDSRRSCRNWRRANPARSLS
jgi:hypothetical protein